MAWPKPPKARPIRAYRGGSTPIDELRVSPDLSAAESLWFSGSRRSAQNYATHKIETSNFDTDYGRPRVHAADLRLRRPLVIDGRGARYDEIPLDDLPPNVARTGDVGNTHSIAEAARAAGYDGVILRNVRDSADVGNRQVDDIIAVFSPESIEAARGSGLVPLALGAAAGTALSLSGTEEAGAEEGPPPAVPPAYIAEAPISSDPFDWDPPSPENDYLGAAQPDALDAFRDIGGHTRSWTEDARVGSLEPAPTWLEGYDDPADPYSQGKQGFSDWAGKGQMPVLYPLSQAFNWMGQADRWINQQDPWEGAAQDVRDSLDEQEAYLADNPPDAPFNPSLMYAGADFPMSAEDMGAARFVADQVFDSPVMTASNFAPLPGPKMAQSIGRRLGHWPETPLPRDLPIGEDLGIEFPPPRGLPFELTPDSPYAEVPMDLTPAMADRAAMEARRGQAQRVYDATPWPAPLVGDPLLAEELVPATMAGRRLQQGDKFNLEAALTADDIGPDDLRRATDRAVGNAPNYGAWVRAGGTPGAREGRPFGSAIEEAATLTDEEAATIAGATRLRQDPLRPPEIDSYEPIPWDPRVITPERVRAGATAAGLAALVPLLSQQQFEPESVYASNAEYGPRETPSFGGRGVNLPPPPPGEPPPLTPGADRAGGGYPPPVLGAAGSNDPIPVSFEEWSPERIAATFGEVQGDSVRVAPNDRLFPRYDLDPSNREHVRRVQDALREAGFDPGRSDGVIGPRTTAALAALGAAYGEGPPSDLAQALRMAAGFPRRDAGVGDVQFALRLDPELAAIVGRKDDVYGPKTEAGIEALFGVDAPAPRPGFADPDQDYLNELYYGQILGNPVWRSLRQRQ